MTLTTRSHTTKATRYTQARATAPRTAPRPPGFWAALLRALSAMAA